MKDSVLIGVSALLVAIMMPAEALTQGRPHPRALAIRAEMASVLLQSQRYDEAAREYSVLVAYEPRNGTHRLNLVRSLLWGGRPQEAERELLVLMSQRGRDPALEALLLNTRTQLRPSVREAYAWMRERSTTLEYRQILARALAREGRGIEALAQYDTLIATRPSPGHYLERASVHASRLDLTSAERDVNTAITLGPSGDAWMLAGDLHLARGNHTLARNAYWQARSLTRDVDLAGALARLARDERPIVGLLPEVYGDSPGWHSITSSTGDNLGANLSSTMLRRGTRRFGSFDASAGATIRRFADHTVVASPGAQGVYGADVAASRDGARGRYYGRVRGRVGLTYSSGIASPEGGIAAVAFRDAWGAGFELSVGPAYPGMLTMGSFLASPVTGQQLREQRSTWSVAGPVNKLDVAGSWEGTSLSDGNARRILQALARMPLRPHMALVYAASVLSYETASPLYWSPTQYVSHAIGPELSLKRARGFSGSLRVLPGGAWTRDPADTTIAAGATTSALQLSTAGALSYRAIGWEVGASASYGRGRAGNYERFDATLFLRLTP